MIEDFVVLVIPENYNEDKVDIFRAISEEEGIYIEEHYLSQENLDKFGVKGHDYIFRLPFYIKEDLCAIEVYCRKFFEEEEKNE